MNEGRSGVPLTPGERRAVLLLSLLVAVLTFAVAQAVNGGEVNLVVALAAIGAGALAAGVLVWWGRRQPVNDPSP